VLFENTNTFMYRNLSQHFLLTCRHTLVLDSNHHGFCTHTNLIISSHWIYKCDKPDHAITSFTTCAVWNSSWVICHDSAFRSPPSSPNIYVHLDQSDYHTRYKKLAVIVELEYNPSNDGLYAFLKSWPWDD
jgi:hypothetical protein